MAFLTRPGTFKSARKNKPVIVDLYTDWCLYCKDLENKIFPKRRSFLELQNL